MNTNTSKKKLTIAIILLFTAMLICCIILSVVILNSITSLEYAFLHQKQNIQHSNEEMIDLKEKEITFYFGEYNGKIGIYTPESDAPIRVLNTLVSTLPEIDRAMLRNRIIVHSVDELVMLVQDYTS